jgi:hypothetical protein
VRAVAKKVILIILGVLLALCGILAACGGGGLLGVAGTSGTIHSGYHTISTPTDGFVSDPTRIEDNSNVRVSGSGVTIRVNARNTSAPVFLGIGPAAQVNSYLAGAPVENVTDINFSPFRLTTQQVQGTVRPAAPADQSFWVAQASGVRPSLTWKITDGNYRLVIMNADASSGVRLDARVGVTAGILGGLGLGLLIGGIVVALGGIALLVWGIRSRRRPPPSAAVPAYPSGYGPTGGAPSGWSPSGGSTPPPPGSQPPASPYQPPGSPTQPGGTPSGGPDTPLRPMPPPPEDPPR